MEHLEQIGAAKKEKNIFIFEKNAVYHDKNGIKEKIGYDNLNLFKPRVFRSPFQIFYAKNKNSKENKNEIFSKWKNLTEIEINEFVLESKIEEKKFEHQWIEIVKIFLFLNKKRSFDRENDLIVKDIVELANKYGKKFVFNEIYKLIKITKYWRRLQRKRKSIKMKKNKRIKEIKEKYSLTKK